MNYEDMLEKGKSEVPENFSSRERFEIPKVETQREGNKTRITNFKDLTKKLHRDKKHLSKFLLKELGTAGHVQDDELLLQGKFRRKKINKKLKKYCEKYVLCKECKRPDTKLVKEKGVMIIKCEACGARNSLEK